MTIQFRAAGTNTSGTGTGTAVSVTIPSSAQAGDVAIFAEVSAGTPTHTMNTSGWTQRATAQTGSNHTIYVHTKVLTASDPGSSISVTLSAAQVWAAAVCCWYRASDYNAISSVSQDTTADTAFTAPAVTPTVHDCARVYVVAFRIGTALGPTCTAPTGFTERADASSQRGSSNPNVGITMGDLFITGGSGTSQSAVTNGVFSASSASTEYCLTIAPTVYADWNNIAI